jgi:hypothetical protein
MHKAGKHYYERLLVCKINKTCVQKQRNANKLILLAKLFSTVRYCNKSAKDRLKCFQFSLPYCFRICHLSFAFFIVYLTTLSATETDCTASNDRTVVNKEF